MTLYMYLRPTTCCIHIAHHFVDSALHLKFVLETPRSRLPELAEYIFKQPTYSSACPGTRGKFCCYFLGYSLSQPRVWWDEDDTTRQLLIPCSKQENQATDETRVSQRGWHLGVCSDASSRSILHSQSCRVKLLGIGNAPTEPPAVTKKGPPRSLLNSTPSPNAR